MQSPVNIKDILPWVEFGNTVSAKSIWPFKTRVYASYKQKEKRLIETFPVISSTVIKKLVIPNRVSQFFSASDKAERRLLLIHRTQNIS